MLGKFVIYLTTFHVLLVIVHLTVAEYQYICTKSNILLLLYVHVYCVLTLSRDGQSCPA
jgi:hypothetical protein